MAVGEVLDQTRTKFGFPPSAANRLLDGYVLLLYIYAAGVVWYFSYAWVAAAPLESAQKRKWLRAYFVNLWGLATALLTAFTGVLLPSGSAECATILGFACQSISFATLWAAQFSKLDPADEAGPYSLRWIGQTTLTLGLALAGTGLIVLHRSTGSLAAALPSAFALAIAAQRTKRVMQKHR